MSLTFSCPELPATQIVTILEELGIVSLRAEDLAAPTADLACTIYSGLLANFYPLRQDLHGQLDFGALQLLDNPEHHADAIGAINLFRQVKELLASIRLDGFKLADLLMPDPRRMNLILSAVVNLLFYREEKLVNLQPIFDKLHAFEEKRTKLEQDLTELKKQSMDHEVARQLEEPMVQDVKAEVEKLKQSTQDYNKQQVLMRNQAKELKDKIDAADSKISRVDFELLKKAQEKTDLLSEIVQSPDKLQRALEEKRKKLAEVKNSEKIAMQNYQEKTATMEVYLKASEKLSKLSSRIQAMQDQLNSAKNIEKDVKALKVKLSDDAVSNMSIEAKMVDLLGKAKQAEELLRTIEKERNTRHAEDNEKLDNVRTEMEQMLNCLESRERKIEDMVAESDRLRVEADSVWEAEMLKQQKMLSKLEEIVHAFHSYSNTSLNTLQNFEAELVFKDDNLYKSSTST